MTPKDEKIADLAKEKLRLVNNRDRLKGYRDYLNKGEFTNPAKNKAILQTLSGSVLSDLIFQIELMSASIASIDTRLAILTASNNNQATDDSYWQ
jgi:hypothetical protein